MSSNNESAPTLPQLPSNDEKQRALGRTLVGTGGLGILFGLFLPLMGDPDFPGSAYSLMDTRQLGTPGLWVLLAGAIALLVAAVLLVERVQTLRWLVAVLVLAWAEVLGLLFTVAVAVALIWTGSRSHVGGAEFKYGTVILMLSCAVIIPGAFWWSIHHGRRE